MRPSARGQGAVGEHAETAVVGHDAGAGGRDGRRRQRRQLAGVAQDEVDRRSAVADWAARRRAHDLGAMGRVDAHLGGSGDGLGVAGVGVAHDARAGVGGEHAAHALGHHVGAVGHHDHAGVQALAYAHAAAVVEAHPARRRPWVQQGVEDGPVGDRVGAVAHGSSVAGYGEAREPESRWSRPMAMGAPTRRLRRTC